MISTVHTNQTAIEKALLGVLQASDVNLPSDRVKAISKLANCDMSVALNLLSLTPKLRKSMLNEESVQKDLSDANLFHRLGKVMYNKRKNVTPKAAGEAGKKEKEEKDTIRYEGKEFDKYKSQHYFDPLDLIRRQNNFSRLSQRDFRGLVFENYLDFVGDVADVSKICHEFARIDKYDRCLFFDRDETLKASWDEYISFLYVLAFMNNARTDNHDRKRLFNFQYPKFMEKKLREYLPKYDYFKVDKSLLGDAEQVEAVADDIDENPEDDISIDYEENARFNSGFGYSNNKLKAEELDELDDIEAMVTGTSKASELVCEKGVAPKREYEGASSSLLRKSQEDEHELQDLDEEEMLAELNDLVFQHKSSTTVVAKAKKSPKSCVVSQMDIESELNDIL